MAVYVSDSVCHWLVVLAFFGFCCVTGFIQLAGCCQPFDSSLLIAVSFLS